MGVDGDFLHTLEFTPGVRRGQRYLTTSVDVDRIDSERLTY
jgi:hypothetical protein